MFDQGLFAIVIDEFDPSKSEALAKTNFKKQFRYDWSSSNSSPLDKDGTAQPLAASDYCAVDADQDLAKAIKKYVDEGLAYASSTLPSTTSLLTTQKCPSGHVGEAYVLCYIFEM